MRRVEPVGGQETLRGAKPDAGHGMRAAMFQQHSQQPSGDTRPGRIGAGSSGLSNRVVKNEVFDTLCAAHGCADIFSDCKSLKM